TQKKVHSTSVTSIYHTTQTHIVVSVFQLVVSDFKKCSQRHQTSVATFLDKRETNSPERRHISCLQPLCIQNSRYTRFKPTLVKQEVLYFNMEPRSTNCKI
ncbi:hypothetical protein KC19_VG025500, partial [Ceratodon purpureus]